MSKITIFDVDTLEKCRQVMNTIPDLHKPKGKRAIAFYSAIFGYVDILKELFEKYNWSFDIIDKKGDSPYLIAAHFGQIKVMEYLDLVGISHRIQNYNRENYNREDAYDIGIKVNNLSVLRYLDKKHNFFEKKYKKYLKRNWCYDSSSPFLRFIEYHKTGIYRYVLSTHLNKLKLSFYYLTSYIANYSNSEEFDVALNELNYFTWSKINYSMEQPFIIKIINYGNISLMRHILDKYINMINLDVVYHGDDIMKSALNNKSFEMFKLLEPLKDWDYNNYSFSEIIQQSSFEIIKYLIEVKKIKYTLDDSNIPELFYNKDKRVWEYFLDKYRDQIVNYRGKDNSNIFLKICNRNMNGLDRNLLDCIDFIFNELKDEIDIGQVNNQGKNAILYCHNFYVIKHLHQNYGFDVNVTDKNGRGPIENYFDQSRLKNYIKTVNFKETYTKTQNKVVPINDRCSICFEEFENNDEVFICSNEKCHATHSECYISFIDSQEQVKKCMLCCKNILTETKIYESSKISENTSNNNDSTIINEENDQLTSIEVS